jgi:nitrite reductase/ring-hydroxylating ferredoxin subunit
MARIKIADVSEFDGDGSRVIEEVRGQEIAVFRHDGEFYALANYCVHQSGPLCEGGLTGYSDVAEDMWDWEFDTEEKYLSCPWHGWVFDITTGRNAKDDSYAVPTYEVEVADGEVFVHR